jgi:hypothetical protein
MNVGDPAHPVAEDPSRLAYLDPRLADPVEHVGEPVVEHPDEVGVADGVDGAEHLRGFRLPEHATRHGGRAARVRGFLDDDDPTSGGAGARGGREPRHAPAENEKIHFQGHISDVTLLDNCRLSSV